MFETVKGAWEDLFERRYGFWRGLLDGIVNGYPASARGLAFHIAGHERHHLRIIRSRYLPLAERLG